MFLSKHRKQRLLTLAVLLIGGYFANYFIEPPANNLNDGSNTSTVADLYQQGRSDVQIQVHGHVSRVLADDTKGSQHQRFIIKLNDNNTVLVAHNIDLAPRVANLKTGDAVTVFGEYEWNQQGGVLHWTHHDPAQRHIDGWIEHNGKRYQ